MTITDQIRNVLRASHGPLTVAEIHKLLPAKTLLTSVDAICWPRRRSGEFSRVSIGTRTGYVMNPSFKGGMPNPAPADEGAGDAPKSITQPTAEASEPLAAPTSAPVPAPPPEPPPQPKQPRPRPRPRQVRVREFIPARPEIMVVPLAPSDIAIQESLHSTKEEGQLIPIACSEIPALIRALAKFSDEPLEKILREVGA